MDNSDSHLVKLSIYHSPKISTSEQMINPLINLILFYLEEHFSWRPYLVEWCRWWWLWALGGCHTIPQTQGLGEWPNSGWYCSLVGARSIQPLFRQDETCPGHPPLPEGLSHISVSHCCIIFCVDFVALHMTMVGECALTGSSINCWKSEFSGICTCCPDWLISYQQPILVDIAASWWEALET